MSFIPFSHSAIFDMIIITLPFFVELIVSPHNTSFIISCFSINMLLFSTILFAIGIEIMVSDLAFN